MTENDTWFEFPPAEVELVREFLSGRQPSFYWQEFGKAMDAHAYCDPCPHIILPNKAFKLPERFQIVSEKPDLPDSHWAPVETYRDICRMSRGQLYAYDQIRSAGYGHDTAMDLLFPEEEC